MPCNVLRRQARDGAMISELRVAEQWRVAGAGGNFARILRYKSDVSREGEGSEANGRGMVDYWAETIGCF